MKSVYNWKLCGVIAAFIICAGPSSASDRLNDRELQNLFLNATVEYDYGEFKAFAFTQQTGINFFHMNGQARRFGERENINKTFAKIAQKRICFTDGWRVCWAIFKTNELGVYAGMNTKNGAFIANVRSIGYGDILNIQEQYKGE